MDLKQLEYIVAIADKKNITRAAEALHMTQPALNQQLLRLEKELETPLFVRGRSHMELTKAGEIYVENAKKMLAIKKETYAQIRDLSGKYRYSLKIGLTPERGFHVFSGIYPRFHEKYPDIVIYPVVMNVREQQTQISSGNLSMGIVTLADTDQDENDYIDLRKSGFVVACPTVTDGTWQCPQLPREILSYEELKLLEGLPFSTVWKASTLRTRIDAICDRAGLSPKLLFETESNLTIIRMIQSGLCLGILSDYYAIPADNVTYHPIRLPDTYQVAVCLKRKSKLDEAKRYLIGLIDDFVNSHTVYEPFST